MLSVKYSGEPLNILHTFGLKSVYPLVRVHFVVKGSFDVKRLKKAVMQCAQVVPQIFCRYVLNDNSFEPVTADTTGVIFQSLDPDKEIGKWDLFKDPQLQIYVNDQGQGTYDITIFFSHILTDGAGAKQFLCLLAKAYNSGKLDGIKNHQDIEWLKKLINQHPVKVSRQVDHPAKPLSLPQLEDHEGQIHRTSKVRLTQSESKRLVNASHQQGVTINDLLMATFGQAILRFSDTDKIALTCPTDMRQFIPGPKQLRVANHTSRYNINVSADADEPFSQVVADVHQAMHDNKANFQCLSSVKTLVENSQKLPLSKLQEISKDNYHVRGISYTNFGIIDDHQFNFEGCENKDFDMLGPYRRMPMFQVAGSTYAGQLILAYAMIGNDAEARLGHSILLMMKDMLNNYSLQFGK